MQKWFSTHWRQILTLVLSVCVGVALHAGKLSPDQAVALGAILATVGIHLPPLTYGGAKLPPSTLAAMAALAVMFGAVACSPSVPSPSSVQGGECVSHRVRLELECVDMFDSGPQIDTCRKAVKAAVDCDTPDGGTRDGS